MLNKWRLALLIGGVLVGGMLLFLAVRSWGWGTPIGILATLGIGVGAVTGMTPIKRDPGRAARPDLGGRGTVEVKTKDSTGKTVVVEKRTRPRRPGSGRF